VPRARRVGASSVNVRGGGVVKPRIETPRPRILSLAAVAGPEAAPVAKDDLVSMGALARVQLGCALSRLCPILNRWCSELTGAVLSCA
jgi:hypothetical protein